MPKDTECVEAGGSGDVGLVPIYVTQRTQERSHLVSKTPVSRNEAAQGVLAVILAVIFRE
jgi:hypothetical protein